MVNAARPDSGHAAVDDVPFAGNVLNAESAIATQAA
jgi:hypothetical protein